LFYHVSFLKSCVRILSTVTQWKVFETGRPLHSTTDGYIFDLLWEKQAFRMSTRRWLWRKGIGKSFITDSVLALVLHDI
jgi:hypothetical protein